MKLITKKIGEKLNKAGYSGNKAICKFFGGSSATWVIFGRDKSDPDILMCVADLGMGCVEGGSVSLSELESIKFPPFGLPVERDLYFSNEGKTMSFFLEQNSLAGI